MSRSFKKNPIVGICVGGSGTKQHRQAKKEMTRSTRFKLNTDEFAPSGSYYKKYMHSYQWRPDDGKQYWDNPKAYRK